MSLKAGKAPGNDGITTTFLKMHASTLTRAIHCLFNLCMRKGKFPNPLKTAKIVPLYKGGDSSSLSNYRPVALLPTIGKILEKLLYARISKFVNENNILYDCQYGFRRKSSTTTAATELITKLQGWLDEGKTLAVIFLDISKAFDSISQEKLYQKLFMYGIRGNTLKILKSYFEGRKQFTELEGQTSEVSSIDWGVIQGGNLTALLFVLYINDIAMLKLNGKPYVYADDTAIVYENYDALKMQADVNTLADFYRINVLSLNVKKTKFMVFRSQYNKENLTLPTLHLNQTEILQTSEIRYLGLIIDKHLNWNEHLRTLSKDISRQVGIIYKLRHQLKQKILLRIYHSLIQSKVTYMIAVWGSAFHTHKKQIYILQN